MTININARTLYKITHGKCAEIKEHDIKRRHVIIDDLRLWMEMYLPYCEDIMFHIMNLRRRPTNLNLQRETGREREINDTHLRS